MRRDAEEVRAILPLHATLIDQLQERLVDQRGRLQRVIATFTIHAAARETMQLAVDHGQQLIGGGGVTGGPFLQEARDLMVGISHGPFFEIILPASTRPRIAIISAGVKRH